MAKDKENVAEVEAKVEEKESKETAPKTDDETKETPSKSDGKDYLEENKNLKGHISTLQKKLEAFEEEQKRIARAFAPEEDAKELKAEDVLQKVEELKAELETGRKELAKNQYIDSLEIPESRKQYLKSRVGVDDYETQAQKELEELDRVLEAELQNTPIRDTRPVGRGVERGVYDTDSANDVDIDSLKKKLGAVR